MDSLLRRAIAAVAGELQVTMASVPGWAAAEGALGVRGADVQRALCSALQEQLGSVALVEGPLPGAAKDCWAGWLGRVDVLTRREDGSEAYFETQLCGVEKLHESLWDALKLALYTALSDTQEGYHSVYAAPESGWGREATTRRRSSRAAGCRWRSCSTSATPNSGHGACRARGPRARSGCRASCSASRSRTSRSAPAVDWEAALRARLRRRAVRLGGLRRRWVAAPRRRGAGAAAGRGRAGGRRADTGGRGDRGGAATPGGRGSGRRPGLRAAIARLRAVTSLEQRTTSREAGRHFGFATNLLGAA